MDLFVSFVVLVSAVDIVIIQGFVYFLMFVIITVICTILLISVIIIITTEGRGRDSGTGGSCSSALL